MPYPYLAVASIILSARPAMAEEAPRLLLGAPLTGREAFLAIGIGTMMLCGLASFFLAGRVSERTQTALAMLVVLIGGFCLLVLFGGFIYDNPIAAIAVVLLLIGLFKLMNQFEAARKSSVMNSKDRR
jgi:hypothetical protein